MFHLTHSKPTVEHLIQLCLHLWFWQQLSHPGGLQCNRSTHCKSQSKHLNFRVHTMLHCQDLNYPWSPVLAYHTLLCSSAVMNLCTELFNLYLFLIRYPLQWTHWQGSCIAKLTGTKHFKTKAASWNNTSGRLWSPLLKFSLNWYGNHSICHASTHNCLCLTINLMDCYTCIYITFQFWQSGIPHD